MTRERHPECFVSEVEADVEGCVCDYHVICEDCDEEITLDGHNGTKIASLQGVTCMHCHKDGNE